jgi:hypothetical protein
MMSTTTNTPQADPKPEEAPAQQALAPAPPMPNRIQVNFNPDDPVALYMDTGIFEQLQRVAKLMSSSGLIPEHLRGKQADCFLVAAQAFRWRMDPFGVSQHTFVYKGKLGYEGKLIAAVVNTSSRLERPLSYEYSGSGVDRKVVVSGHLKGEDKPRTIDGTVKAWKTDNDKWASMADQMLSYRGAREWARRHMPEAVLGVSEREEIQETIEVVPGADGVYAREERVPAMDRIAEAVGAPPAEQPPAEREPGQDDDEAPGVCTHPGIPQAYIDNMPEGEEKTCEKCGEVIRGPGRITREKAEKKGKAGQARLSE